jgi:hypothetical protein
MTDEERERVRALMAAIADAGRRMAQVFARLVREVVAALKRLRPVIPPPEVDAKARALLLRQHRHTGPAWPGIRLTN